MINQKNKFSWPDYFTTSQSLPTLRSAMDKESLVNVLLGKELRTWKRSNVVVEAIQDQRTFDELFSLVFHHERLLLMRAIDAVEKVTAKHPEFLRQHKSQLLSVLKGADHKELKSHIVKLIPRLELTDDEMADVWHIFYYWALNKNEKKIVRVNALQGLFDLSERKTELKSGFEKVISAMEHEMIPSIQARIRKLKVNHGAG
jgi:hypothetical protein